MDAHEVEHEVHNSAGNPGGLRTHMVSCASGREAHLAVQTREDVANELVQQTLGSALERVVLRANQRLPTTRVLPARPTGMLVTLRADFQSTGELGLER
jgi:hypothetical protein